MKNILKRAVEKTMPWKHKDRRLTRKIAKLEREIEYLYGYLGLKRGERQYCMSLDDVRPDHIGRYEFACNYIRDTDNVIDAACGVGYGSHLIAQKTGAHVTGIDISASAINSANVFWKHQNVRFIMKDCLNTGLPEKCCDVIVSFETIEHVNEDEKILVEFARLLLPGGRLICSVPNEEVWPYGLSNHKYHVRHYTPVQIEEKLVNHGFVPDELWTQKTRKSKEVMKGKDGVFLIVVAKKVLS